MTELLFEKEEDVWVRISEYNGMFLVYASNTIGDFWILELHEYPGQEDPPIFLLQATHTDPNQDQNVLQFVQEFKAVFYNAVFGIDDDDQFVGNH